MNKILKSYDVNPMTLKTFESFNDKDCSLWFPVLYGFLFICVKFQGQIIIKISTL
jgi:hypothetical protein